MKEQKSYSFFTVSRKQHPDKIVANAILAASLVEMKQNKDNFATDLSHAHLCGWEVSRVLFPVMLICGMLAQFKVTSPEELDAQGAQQFVNLSLIPTCRGQATNANKDLLIKPCYSGHAEISDHV